MVENSYLNRMVFLCQKSIKEKRIRIRVNEIQILTKDGKYFFTWVFQKDDKVYSTSFEGNKETLLKMFDLIEQTWGLDPKTPGK